MKKLILNLFVLSTFIFSLSCSNSDDDGGGNSGGGDTFIEELKVNIGGDVKTFNTIIVDNQNTAQGDGYIFVTATIGTQTNEIITFYVDQDAVGAQAMASFTYVNNGENYSAGSISGSNIPNNYLNSSVTVNNGTRLTATFSGVLLGPYDSATDTYETLSFNNGSVDAKY